jgi:tetratricopeptide (TPR) repeat protein
MRLRSSTCLPEAPVPHASTTAKSEATISELIYISQGVGIIHDVSATMTLFAVSPVPLRLFATIATPHQIRAQLTVLGCASNIELEPSNDYVSMDSSTRIRLQTRLSTSIEWAKYQDFALGAVDMHFPSSFAQPLWLRRGHELYPHVSAIIQHVIGGPTNDAIIDIVASICLRLCMYLLTVGQYARVANVASRFQVWCQQGATTHFEMLTSFQAKEAVARTSQGEFKAALRFHRRIHQERQRKLGKKDLQTIHGLNNVAIAYQDIGRYDRAIEHHQEALRSKTIQLGSNDPDTILSLNNLGVTLQYQGHYDTAEEMFKQTLSAWSKVYEADDLYLLTARSNIGIALHLQGRYQEAEALQRYVSTERQRTLGRTHQETMKSHANLAMTINETGRHAEAETIYREVLHTYQRKLGASHPDTLKMHHNLATALHDQGEYEEAESNISTMLPHLRLTYGNAHAETLEAMEFRAILLHCLERYQLALNVAREVYETRKEHLGFDHDDTQRSLCHVRDLAENCEEEKRMADFPTSISILVA